METTEYGRALESRFDRRSGESNGFLTAGKLLVFDFLLLNLSFFACNFFKKGVFVPQGMYATLLFAFYGCWAVSSFMGKKGVPAEYKTYGSGIFTILKSNLYLGYTVAFWVVVSGGTEYSRLQVFSTCLVLCVLNCLAWSVYSGRFLSRAGDRVNFRNLTEPFRLEKSFSYPLLVMDFVLVVAAFFLLNLIKRGTLVLPDGYVQLFVIFVGLWFTVSMVTGKYAMDRFGSVYHFTWQWIKASGIMLAGMALLLFAFRLFYFSRLHALGAVLALAGMETVLALLYFRAGPRKAEEEDIESADRVRQMLRQEEIPLDVNIALIRQKLMEPAREKIRRQLSEAHPGLFELLDRHIDLNEMVRAETAVERNVELYDPALKELRKKVKPGLIPPFYADLPETFEEICDSERRYIESCLKHPVTTRLAYFWKAFVNIAIKGARSN